MNKIFFTFIISLAFLKVNAQTPSFDWTALDDTIKTIPVMDSIVAFDTDLKNNTNRALDIVIIKQSVSNPKNWANYICAASTCYPPNQDTVRLSIDPNTNINVKYDVDVVAPTNGDVATFKVTVLNNQNSNEVITKIFRVNINQTNRQPNLHTSFSIYPNPVSDFLTVKIDKVIFSIEIFNLNGQLLKTTNQNFINVQDLTSGIYLLKVNTETYSEYHRIVKE